MKFKFFPNSFNLLLITEKNIDDEEFLRLQIKYRESFEKMLMNLVDFKKVDAYIDSFGLKIPVVNDMEYNFYRKYSFLGSKYIFFRNNLHIEKLSTKELEIIRSAFLNATDLDVNFLMATYKKVLYEDGDFAFFGLPVDTNSVSAKTIVFEFAYDQKEFTTLSQYNLVKQLVPILCNSLSKSIKAVVDTDISMIAYNAIPDIYLSDEVNLSKIFK